MARHLKLKHGSSQSPVKAGEAYRNFGEYNIPYTHSFPNRMDRVQENTINSSSGEWLNTAQNWIKKYTEFANSMTSVQKQIGLSQAANFYAEQLKNIYTNYWILPKVEVRAISGYFCRRCKTFSLRPIRDVGFDLTEKAKHVCLQEDLDINKIQLDSKNLADSILRDELVGILKNHMNFYMSGIKYIVAVDMTDLFVLLMKKHDLEGTLKLIGVPDRWYLHSLEQGFNPQWVDRALANLGKKVSLDDAESCDFLRKIQATYAIFQIRGKTSTRWYAISITT
jgi:hypothetical protein